MVSTLLQSLWDRWAPWEEKAVRSFHIITITLCGIQPKQTDIDFSFHRLDAADAKLLAFDLSRNQSVRTVKCAARP